MMNETEIQIFCADPNICAIIAKRNSQDKWQLWGLSDVLETGEAKYETRLFSKREDDVEVHKEYDAIEHVNTTSGRTKIKLLQNNNWHEVVLFENKKAINKPIEVIWHTCYFTNPKNPISLRLRFSYEDEDESIESLLERGAGKNQTIMIDQINTADWQFSEGVTERLFAVIDYFLKNGIDVNVKDEWGETALMAAAKYGSANIVNLLLQNGARINDKNNGGSTAIMYACCRLHLSVVRLLLANGAIADSECFFDIFNQWDLGVDEIEIQIELFKLLLNENIDVNIRNSEGETALMHIVQANCNYQKEPEYFLEKQKELLQLFLDNGANINAKDDNGKTALMYAIESKNKYISEYLIQQGADVSIKDNMGNTALTYAQENSVRILGKIRSKLRSITISENRSYEIRKIKLLFICTVNRMRSATAHKIYENDNRFEVKSAGTDKTAKTVLSDEILNWADSIVVMEKHHRHYIRKHYPEVYRTKRIVCLYIPDNYRYMQEDLIEILKIKVEDVLRRNLI